MSNSCIYGIRRRNLLRLFHFALFLYTMFLWHVLSQQSFRLLLEREIELKRNSHTCSYSILVFIASKCKVMPPGEIVSSDLSFISPCTNLSPAPVGLQQLMILCRNLGCKKMFYVMFVLQELDGKARHVRTWLWQEL